MFRIPIRQKEEVNMEQETQIRAEQEATKKINQIFRQLIYEDSPAWRKFPNGLRYGYYKAVKTPHNRELWFCHSKTKNSNGKYLSWIYSWKVVKKNGVRREADFIKVREHKHKGKAIARAYKLYQRRIQKVAKRTIGE